MPKDNAVPPYTKVKCRCGWQGYPEELGKGEWRKPFGDPERMDFRCPSCKQVMLFGLVALGLFAEEGIEIEEYEH